MMPIGVQYPKNKDVRMAEPSKTGFWATVVTAVVGAIASAALGWLGPLWEWLKRIAYTFTNHLFASNSWPNWVMYCLSIFALVTIVCLVIAWLINRESNYNLYVKDTFFNTSWRWRYIGGTPSDPIPSCVVCSTPIVYSTDFLPIGNPNPYASYSPQPVDQETTLFCETCNMQVHRSMGTWSDLRSKVKRQIHRKLETGEWRSVTH
jgi:hypothetical protein